MIKNISPVTRIEGHIKVKCNVENGRVKDVWISGEMYRGLENLLIGRHPLDAQRITQRVCGVCHEVHGIASSKALADLYKIDIPKNGLLLKDIILSIHMASDHVLHFFHLALADFVDFSSIKYYSGKDPRLLDIKSWVVSGRPYIFTKKVKGDYIKDPKKAIPLIVSYIEAFNIISLSASALATLGGKAPFAHTVFPGGVSVEITSDKIAKVADIVNRLYEFICTRYIPAVVEIAREYNEYFQIGMGYRNLISYGGFEATGTPLYKKGVMINGRTYPLDINLIRENIAYSYYDSEGKAYPDKQKAYSWIKAPRYNGYPMETGPLARLMLTPSLKEKLNTLLKEAGSSINHAFSVMGRHIARALEAKILAEYALSALALLNPDEPTINTVDVGYPISGKGIGLSNAARGDLLHYIEAENSRITKYVMIVPTTWNFSPRDERGVMGPAEKAIMNTPVRFGEGLIEVGRVIRSFDPCTACSVH